MSVDPDPARHVLSEFLLKFVPIRRYPSSKRRKWGFAVRAAESGLGMASAGACLGPIDEAPCLPSVLAAVVEPVQKELGFHSSFQGNLDVIEGGVGGLLARMAAC